MSTFTKSPTFLYVLLIVAVLAVSASPTQAESLSDLLAGNGNVQIVSVEEEWELVVDEAIADIAAPQITTAFSPVGHIGGIYATLDINHHSEPEFSPGGLQLHVFQGEEPIWIQGLPDRGTLRTVGEVITWKQWMSVHNGVLTFSIDDGSSDTWGHFGGQGNLVAQFETELTNLNGYNPQVSVANSGVGYASNRVRSLILKSVRVYTSSNSEHEFSVNGVVDDLDN